MKSVMVRMAVVAVLVAAVGVRGAEPAAAPEAKRTEITSARLTFDYEKMTALFDGNVVVQDPSMRLEADKLQVAMDQVSQQITLATAYGHVKITEKDRVATGDQAEYNAKEGKLVLTGNAEVKRGRETLKGNRMTFLRGDNKVYVERVTMTLFPEKGQSLQGMIQ